MSYLQNLSVVELIILSIFSLAFIIQLFIYLYFYLRIRKCIDKPTEAKSINSLSVIICAHNEAVNLENFLPAVLTQDYPDFEVIVVNDGSTDGTDDVLTILKSQYDKLYVTTIPTSGKFKSGKKLAISLGLKAAKHEWVVMTDADCEPVSKNWLTKINENIDDKTDFILGYGGYFSKKGFLNRLIKFDTLFIALQYFTFAKAKIPYMGVGRNMAYRKSIFFNNKGFSKHLHLASGDDDLFVNENANYKNTKLLINPESFTRSIPKKTFKTWIYQKKRHITTAKYYKPKHKFVLIMEILFRVILYATLIAGLFYLKLLLPVLILYFIRYILQLGILYKASVKFNEKGIFYLGIIFDFILPFINFIVHLSNIKLRKRKK
jgi:glycosyltransferase involved in cell wall biosynthesis